jgi:hypothetical protein
VCVHLPGRSPKFLFRKVSVDALRSQVVQPIGYKTGLDSKIKDLPNTIKSIKIIKKRHKLRHRDLKFLRKSLMMMETSSPSATAVKNTTQNSSSVVKVFTKILNWVIQIFQIIIMKTVCSCSSK